MNNTFKHSGTIGDLIYGLPIVKHEGGGDFYLHLNQINWITQHYYGSAPNPFHAGRMNLADFDFLKDFMEAQSYINKFEIFNDTVPITHNLDKFRPLFVGHPGNYVDIYAQAFGIADVETKTALRTTPWLTTPNVRTVSGRNVAICRSQRWLPPKLSDLWTAWKADGLDQRAFFIGLDEEYQAFKQQVGWDIPHQKINNLLEMAEYINGANAFIGNQSAALSVAIGLGCKEIWCEGRRDLLIERNECYFPQQPGLRYF
jgi:hypothetical protein